MTSLHLRGVFLPDEIERDAWIIEGKLTFTRPRGDHHTVVDGGYIIPGFIDAHCHIGYAPDGFKPEPEDQVAQAITNRDAGVLLIRDAGSPVDNTGIQLRPELPRLIRAGRHIARPHRYIRDLGVEVEPADLADEVGRQARRGDGWVKIAADWIDRSTGDLAPVWPDDVLAEAVRRAHESGARVACHVFGEDALPGLIAAGIDSIEHGTGLTADLLDEVARQGIAVVPTLVNIDNFPGIAAQAGEKYPVYRDHILALYGTSRARIRDVWEAGIAIYTGTDAGGTLPHGLIRDEIRALVAAGIPQPDVIAQASWRGRAWLGLPGLTEGGLADLVAYEADPRVELETLMAPRRTIIRGAVVA